MANSVVPDQTAPIGAVCSEPTLFASIFNLSVSLGRDDFSRQHFQMHFFLQFKGLIEKMEISAVAEDNTKT